MPWVVPSENDFVAPRACSASPAGCAPEAGRAAMSLIKSKARVADHGEVFTPAWLVEAMLDLVKGETERIDSRFLEPACGDGNFLVPVLRRKLAAVELKYGKSDFERRHYALLGLKVGNPIRYLCLRLSVSSNWSVQESRSG